MDVDQDINPDAVRGFDMRHSSSATDFELPDYWDEGELHHANCLIFAFLSSSFHSLLFKIVTDSTPTFRSPAKPTEPVY